MTQNVSKSPLPEGHPLTATFEVYDVRTGDVIEKGYRSKLQAKNAIAWAWNTGGDISHLAVRRDPTWRLDPKHSHLPLEGHGRI